MAIFSKVPSSKELLNHLTAISNLPLVSDQQISFLGTPLALSDSISIEALSMLTWIDVYRLRYANKQQSISPLTFFYYDNVISRPALSDARSLVKQKKETDLLLHSLGLSALTQKEYVSFIPEFSSRIGHIFSKLFNRGDIKYGYQSVFRNIRYQTIAPLENINFKEEEHTTYVVKYFISTKNHSLDVYVEDPSTMFGDVAIAINPLHKKAKLLKGQMAIIPIINKTIPIIIDERASFATHGGIMRITPGHDALSLSIAKDHALPLDVYSFDASGNFEAHAGLFAGKPVTQFLNNIIQNLSDIGNLIDKDNTSVKVPYSRLTDEKLFVRTHKGRFLEIPQTTMDMFLSDPQTQAGFNGIMPVVSNIFPVSTPSALGYRVPIWTKTDGSTVLIDEESIITAFHKKQDSNKQNILTSLFVFHAIQEGYLTSRFALEDIVECFFSPSFIKDTQLWESWIDVYNHRYPEFSKEISLISTILSGLKEDPNNEQYLNDLSDYIESSFALVQSKQGLFEIDFATINSELVDAIQSKETIITYLLYHILLLDACGFFDEEKTPDTGAILNIFAEEERNKFGSCSLLAYYLKGIFPRGKSFSYNMDSQKNIAWDIQNIRKYIQSYGSDVVRWHLMDSFHSDNNHSEAALDHTQELLLTFRNASRYIKTTLLKDSTTHTSLAELYQDIVSHIDQIHAFDSWILGSLQTILEEKFAIQSPLEISGFSHRILQFMKEDFSTKYLELIKTSPSPLSAKIALLVDGILIKLYFPYAPLTSSELWSQMGFEGHIVHKMADEFFPSLQKSYLISLFMDIIDKFSHLKTGLSCKKHDTVSIFIKANPDFLKFCQGHEELLKKTLHAEDIAYLPYNEQTPNSYMQEEIIDITIGIKRFSKDNPFCLASLTKKLAEKQDYLQHLRNLLSSLNSNGGSPEVITKKREEIQVVKDEIEALELEIYKLKAN